MIEDGESIERAENDPFVCLAREAVERYVRDGEVVEPPDPSEFGSSPAGVFVSLHSRDGALRGCLGTFLPTRASLPEEVIANAVAAASRDPRFLPVTPAELPELEVSVDVLHQPEEVEGPADLDPKRYGLIVRTEDGRQALLLPDLAGVRTVEQQLLVTCRKGGIHPTRDTYRLYRFEVERHGKKGD